MIRRRIGRPLPLRSWYHWYLDANLLVAQRMIRNWMDGIAKIDRERSDNSHIKLFLCVL